MPLFTSQSAACKLQLSLKRIHISFTYWVYSPTLQSQSHPNLSLISYWIARIRRPFDSTFTNWLHLMDLHLKVLTLILLSRVCCIKFRFNLWILRWFNQTGKFLDWKGSKFCGKCNLRTEECTFNSLSVESIFNTYFFDVGRALKCLFLSSNFF